MTFEGLTLAEYNFKLHTCILCTSYKQEGGGEGRGERRKGRGERGKGRGEERGKDRGV